MRPDQCVETHCRRLDGELARATTSARVDYIEATSCNPYRLENLMSRDTRGVEGQLVEEDTSRGFLLDTISRDPRPPYPLNIYTVPALNAYWDSGTGDPLTELEKCQKS